MADIFRLRMFPARQGDCLWVEYGDEQHPRRIWLDGGTPETSAVLRRQLESLPEGQRTFEVLIVTHVDSDHIGGLLPFLEDGERGFAFNDLWFNAWRHLQGSELEAFGPLQGEKLAAFLDENPELPWNWFFQSKRVCVLQGQPLPVVDLPGGMRLTLLSPGASELRRLRPYWADECKKAGLAPGQPATSSHPVPAGFEAMGPINVQQLAQEPFKPDESPANGSSIAVLAEYAGKRILLAGDAHAPVLLKSIRKIAPGRERLWLDAFKLSHHGSKHNLSRELLEKLDCHRYLFSTDGTQFKHPDRQTVARILRYGRPNPELLFNYCSEYNRIWKDGHFMAQNGYRVDYPAEEGQGLVIHC